MEPLFSAPQCFVFIRLLRSHRRSGLHFLCREKVTKSGRGAPRAPVQGDSHPAGGVGPACRSIRGRIRASTGPLVGLALPAPLGQGGGRQPSPPAVRGGIWASATPWVGCGKWGPKGSLEPLRIQWRARLPGPSGSLALRRTAHRLTRGRAEAWNRP